MKDDVRAAVERLQGVGVAASRSGVTIQAGSCMDHDLKVVLAALLDADAKLNAPELHDFSAGVVLEAAHQRERWGSEHDVGKEPEDWFWVLGYLSGKVLAALKAGDPDKALHHTISSGALLANWHAAIGGTSNEMRPGIDADARGVAA